MAVKLGHEFRGAQNKELPLTRLSDEASSVPAHRLHFFTTYLPGSLPSVRL
jgi:hypothetical protein